MRCPKCNSEFETFRYADVEIDRCAGCGGIRLDAQEHERLENIKGAGSLDVGNRRVGKQHNQMRNVLCPKCEVGMMRMADGTQFHIEYESCPTCSGAFFDAGEFKDLSELTAIERFKKMIDLWLSVR